MGSPDTRMLKKLNADILIEHSLKNPISIIPHFPYLHHPQPQQMKIKLKRKEQIKILCADDIYSIMQRVLLRENKIDRNREHF